MSRISYRSHPVLKPGDEGLHSLTTTVESIADFEKVQEFTYSLINECKKGRVTAISDTFAKSALTAAPKLWPALYSTPEDCTGVFLRGTIVYFASIKVRTPERAAINVVATSAKGDILLSGTFNSLDKTKDLAFTPNGVSHIIGDKTGLIKQAGSEILTWYLFKKYATVEIIESKARTKMHAQGCKYLNETDIDIEYLDSKWFTTLVNSKGFKVGGHFRLQPKKKDGEWTKELIWIDDFEKKGYTRKAGTLNTKDL